MPDAAAARYGLAAIGHLVQDFQAALGLDHLDFAGRILYGQSG